MPIEEEYISAYDESILLGTNKETINQAYINHQFIQISSILAFRKYLEFKYNASNMNDLKLYQLTSCLLHQQCNAISTLDDIVSLKLIFKERYMAFLEDLKNDLLLRKTILKSIDTEMSIYIYDSIHNTKTSLLKDIDNSIDYLDNLFVKRIFADDSSIDIDFHEKYNTSIAKLKEDKKNKKITEATYKREEKKQLLYFKSVMFSDKLTLIHNTFLKVKKDLQGFLNSNFKYHEDEVIHLFEDDFKDVNSTLDILNYNSKKNETYKNLFTYLSEHGANYTLFEDKQKYYIYIYDILMFKYKLLTVFIACKIHKVSSYDLESIIDRGLTNNLQDRKKYIRFFNTITKVSHINSYLYHFLSPEGTTNPMKILLNHKDNKKIKLSIVNIYPIFSTILEKSKNFNSFKSFQMTNS